MQDLELSIIIPVKNVEHTIGGILRSAAHQTAGLQAEFIVVDMDSSDRTVLEAYQLSKELKIQGCVVRSGDSNLAVALNTGIQKAEGQYVSFFSCTGCTVIFCRNIWKPPVRVRMWCLAVRTPPV